MPNPCNPLEVTAFPTLYKKTNTGAIQFWQIEVHPCCGNGNDLPAEIITTYGQVGTDKPQCTIDVIEEGKNAGKKNATTALEQAIKEAEAKHEKQRKKGYVDSTIKADEGSVDEIIEGGINPMLAASFFKHGDKIVFPCFAQAKLDGHRCIAVIQNGKCTLWSRTRKRINSVPHIVAELEKIFPNQTVTLDGELYNHDYKDKFEVLTSAIRQEEPAENHTIVQYHVYDVVMAGTFVDRLKFLVSKLGTQDSCVNLVNTATCVTEEDVKVLFDGARSGGYEGIMLRNTDSLYENRRSYGLQKVKEFDDAEFEICGVEEGNGKLTGMVGAFVCKTDGGKIFKVKMSGETERLRDYFENHSLWQGKKLTVQYQGLTGKEKVPRFPVGLRIREDV